MFGPAPRIHCCGGGPAVRLAFSAAYRFTPRTGHWAGLVVTCVVAFFDRSVRNVGCQRDGKSAKVMPCYEDAESAVYGSLGFSCGQGSVEFLVAFFAGGDDKICDKHVSRHDQDSLRAAAGRIWLWRRCGGPGTWGNRGNSPESWMPSAFCLCRGWLSARERPTPRVQAERSRAHGLSVQGVGCGRAAAACSDFLVCRVMPSPRAPISLRSSSLNRFVHSTS